MSVRELARGIVFTLPALATAACSPSPENPAAAEETAASARPAADPDWVGRDVCAGCHPGESGRWQGSHHDLAMQEVRGETVLGDFADADFTHFDVTSTFFRRDGGFFVRTEGPDGAEGELEIVYTFGVEPLQQYLGRLSDGRFQALTIAWDSRPEDAGGQRWYPLHPGEPIPHDDALHWTAPGKSWNFMCADCHSTGLRKGYDPEADRYETTWREIDVSCEACHGRGSDHVAWARGDAPDAPGRGLVVDLRNEADWVFEDGESVARREGPPVSHAELEACAPCHSRRAPVAQHEPGRPFLDGYRPALLDEGLYHADGQVREEVYVWGSFLQSPMHARGVVCSDCHEPHALRVEGDPDATCARCHSLQAFATPAHHRHPPGSPGASCVECHMPATTYMGIDARRDHSFRVPRPDVAERIGAPDACTGCHSDRSAAWAAAAIASWTDSEETREPHYGEILHAGRRRLPGAARLLAELSQDPAAPDIARATALRLLGEQSQPAPARAVGRGLEDPSPLVRLGALDAARRLPPAARLRRLGPLLRDPLRAVRIHAAWVLLSVPAELWPPAQRTALAEAIAEYRAAQELNADRPEAHVNLGVLHARSGELEAALEAYETALRLDPSFLPAYVNLADLHRQRGRDEEGEPVLRRALAIGPENAEVHHALGLLQVRERRLEEALASLEQAADLAPERPRYAYVHGIALHSRGRTGRALEVLDRAHQRHPGDRDLLLALATTSRDRGDVPRAREYARKLVRLDPEDPEARALLHQLAGPEDG